MPNLVTCASTVFLVYELQCSDIIVDIHVGPGWASFAVRPNLNKTGFQNFITILHKRGFHRTL